MSGGDYDYAYGRVNDFCDKLAQRARTPIRRAFLAHLVKVSQAMHDIEWVDSGDCAPGDEDAAIRACLAPGDDLAQCIIDARQAESDLHAAIRAAELKA